MRRREFMVGIAALGASRSVGARAQSASKPFLIALLHAGSSATSVRTRSGFRDRLNELGYVEGRDYLIEGRYADGVLASLPVLAEELVRLKPKILLAVSTPAALAAHRATSKIPIVAPSLGDPVGLGLIASQARPGTNVTGILSGVEELTGKQLALAHELVPGAAKIGLLVNTRSQTFAFQQNGAELAAAALGIDLVPVEVQSPADLDDAFATLARARVRIVFVTGDTMFLNDRRRIAALGLSLQLPTMYTFREHVEEGGLVSYGVDFRESSRRAADYVVKIVGGAAPADLPVELPTKFELVLNGRTAKELSLTIPDTLLARADEVIE